MEDLRTTIEQAERNSDIDEKCFIPEDQIEELISPDSLAKYFHLSPDIPIEKIRKVIYILILGTDVNANLITSVYESGLTNDYLPVTNEGSQDLLRAQSTDSQKASKTFQAFPKDGRWRPCGLAVEQLQWKVLSPIFGLGEHLVLPLNVILPIIKCYPEQDGSKGQGSVREIQVHPTHLRRRWSQSQLVSK
ncbi:hypothetical protein F4803DRAFT_479592 [Xylaria telfairii]|nr:hypothetical protein F4803DRAFT_479592 [Xylaria telfairii]